MISIVTVSHGHLEDVRHLTRSLVEHMSLPFELVVVDNLNEEYDWEGALVELGIDTVHVIRNNRPRSFSHNNNKGAAEANFPNLVFLNPDIQLIDTSLCEWLKGGHLSDGLFFPCLLNPDGSPQAHSKAKPRLFNQLINTFLRLFGIFRDSPDGTYWYFGAALIVNEDFFCRLGKFDTNFPLFAEDAELCDRARKRGFPVERIDSVQLIHQLGGQSKGKYLLKAIISNVYLRFKMLKNTIDSILT